MPVLGGTRSMFGIVRQTSQSRAIHPFLGRRDRTRWQHAGVRQDGADRSPSSGPLNSCFVRNRMRNSRIFVVTGCLSAILMACGGSSDNGPTPTFSETVLHSFGAGTDGANPSARMI